MWPLRIPSRTRSSWGASSRVGHSIRPPGGGLDAGDRRGAPPNRDGVDPRRVGESSPAGSASAGFTFQFPAWTGAARDLCKRIGAGPRAESRRHMPRLALQTAGESHGPLLTGLVTGLPAGPQDRRRRSERGPRAAPARVWPRRPDEDREGRSAIHGRSPRRRDARRTDRLRDREPRLCRVGESHGADRVDVEAAGKRKLTSPVPATRTSPAG